MTKPFFARAFIIPLPPISKKNSQRILYKKTRFKTVPFIAPSKNFEEYQRNAGYFIKGEKIDAAACPVNVRCLFYMPTKRRVDLVNLLEAVDDILTHYGIIDDDDMLHVGGHDGSRIFFDKENPRTEIYISPLVDELNK